MANPSTIWSQLALPNPAAGSIPFVDSDNVTVVTDVLNFFYDATLRQLKISGGLKVGYTDISAVPGAGVVNTPAGRAAFKAGQSGLIITSAIAVATSIVHATLEQNDATLTSIQSIMLSPGSFLLNGNAVATADCKVRFTVTNTI